MEKYGKIGIEDDNRFAKTWALFSKQYGYMPHKNAWAPFSNYTLQLHMDFHGFKWLISFCACRFQISIIMFIFLYRLTGGDDHADQRGKACLKCFCDTFDSDRCMNSLTRPSMNVHL